MEFVLKNANIFDKNIALEVDELIKKNIELFDTNKCYKVTVNFNCELNYSSELIMSVDSIFNEIENAKDEKDIINKLLSMQLHRIVGSFEKSEIFVENSTICGRKLESNLITILIDKLDNNKNEKTLKVSVIAAYVDDRLIEYKLILIKMDTLKEKGLISSSEYSRAIKELNRLYKDVREL